MEPVLIAKENTPMVLQLIGQDIEKVMAKFPGDTYSQLVYDLYNQRRQLWILPTEEMRIQAWMVTMVERGHDNVRRLILHWMGGNDLESMWPHLEKLEAWALSLGISHIRAYSRPGFRKKLRERGFRHACDVVEKDLKGRLH